MIKARRMTKTLDLIKQQIAPTVHGNLREPVFMKLRTDLLED